MFLKSAPPECSTLQNTTQGDMDTNAVESLQRAVLRASYNEDFVG